MKKRSRSLQIVIAAGFILLAGHVLSVPAFSASKTAAIPAKLAVVPVKVQPIMNVEMKTSDDKNISSKLPALLSATMEKSIQGKGTFLKVVAISDRALPSSASIAELAQAGRDVEADIVLEGRVLEFEGKIDYGFKTSLKEHMLVELVIYETATGKRLWHGRETVDKERNAPLNAWSDEMVEKKYITMAAEETLPAVLEALLTKIGVDMADYKPSVAEKVAVAAADFTSDVDRVPRFSTAIKQNSFAVVIGIEAYRDLAAAEFTVRDAKMMKEYLVRVLGFPQENVITLLNERATRGDIEGYIGTWLKNSVEKNSSVFVYYAGHGAPNPVTGEPYIIPYDGNPAFLEASAIPLKKVYEMLAGLDVKEILVVMDSCFSGGGGRSVMAKGGRPIAVSVENPLLVSKNIIVMSASKGTEISSSYPEKRHGLFTYFLLKGLQGEADITGDKTINVEKLYNYITPKVKKVARDNNREQTPMITPDLEMLGNRARQPIANVGR